MSEWKTVRLGDMLKTSSGGTPSKKNNDYYHNGNIPWILSGDISQGHITKANNFITQLGLDNSSAKFFPKGTVLVAMYGATVGQVGILDIEATTNQAICGIFPDNHFSTNYLFYFCKSQKEHLLNLAIGGAQPNISQEIIKNLQIPLPPLETQEQIATQLDKCTTIIAKYKQMLEKYDMLIKSRFIEMFGETGRKVPLTDYVWFQEGPGVRSVDFTQEGTRLLTGSNINDNEISFGLKSDRFISHELANGKYKHFICDKNDILVVSSAIAPEKFDQKVTIVRDEEKYCLNTGIIRFKPNKDFMTIDYFKEFLKTDYFKHQVMAEMRGIAQMHFGPSHLKKMFILLPESIENQKQFAGFVQQIDKSKFAVQKSLEKAETLYKSLMQEYFG